MAYANIDDIFARFPPIHTLVGSSSNEVSSIEVSSVYIADAEGVVDMFLGAKYATPLNTTPAITHITCDLAIFHMLSERTGRVPQSMQSRYERAISYLEGLRDGDMVLNANSQTFTSSWDSFAWSSTASYHPTFSPVLHELDQAVDADWVDYAKDQRSGD
jgi:phage gp36-like protein